MGDKMTKVPERQLRRRVMSRSITHSIIGFSLCLAAAAVVAQPIGSQAQCPLTTSGLYARIRSVGLDPGRVYRVRDASIDRPNLHLDFEAGTLAFTEDVCGRITGAFFEGEGEIRLRPPNKVERGSLALFTGMAILEEQFTSGYLRFNDDTAAGLQPFLLPAPESTDFIKEWDDTSRLLAEFDALRLMLDFSHFLPTPGGNEPDRKFPALLHAHLLGKKLGSFEVIWDAAGAEPLWAGQPRVKDGILFFDIWTSFAPGGAGSSATPRTSDASIESFRIRTAVQPPTRLQATTEVNVHVRNGGARTLLFELSRYLKLDAVEVDGRPADFIQNPAIGGSHLQRRGNDLVAVVFPAPLASTQQVRLSFTYGGEVLSDAGGGLLYVGERGTWYPNLGLSPAQFEMEFHYPPGWTLVATGKQILRVGGDNPEPNQAAGAELISRWKSERPIPVAGFNLGKYVRAEARAGSILVEAYGTKGVEKSFPKGQTQVIEQPTFPGTPKPRSQAMGPMVVATPPPSPARDVQAVADRAAKAVMNFSQWFGPYPYSSLALTQMPGDLSQGWPGLVFLSSFAFLNSQEQTDLRLDPVTRALDNQVLVHETAHQWWGDLVLWRGYRDQWLAEGLANYASLLMLEQHNPGQFRQVLEKYRSDLLSKNKDGEWLRDAGPVTLGQRLVSSHFPDGYEAISYERGTWLFHMLRMMLRDAEAASHGRKGRANIANTTDPVIPINPEEPFFRALRKAQDRYAGKSISTKELIQLFEEELPRPLWYEKRPKLDWFLEGWIEGTAIPVLEANDIRITEKAGVTTVTGVIVQKDVPDDLVTAVPVYAKTSSNALVFLGEVLADGTETTFRLTAPSDARKIVLDPKQTILTALK
jgi:Peptidase family M1 domain